MIAVATFQHWDAKKDSAWTPRMAKIVLSSNPAAGLNDGCEVVVKQHLAQQENVLNTTGV